MNDSASLKITDSDFAHAVDLIDAGKAEELRDWVDSRPELLSQTVDEDGSTFGDYFANPKLIWFVAENPIRNGQLPENIAEVTQTLIDLARKHNVGGLIDQLNYTLALVSSGMIARQCGVQRGLIETLVAGGADPNSIIQSALAHGETDACAVAIELGAEVTLQLAAGLGREEDTRRLSVAASHTQLQEALAMASINAQAACVQLLLDAGADPNQFNPEGMHAHSTPLHQAAYNGSTKTVQVLLKHGADPSIKDKIFKCSPRQWAEHEGHAEIATMMQ